MKEEDIYGHIIGDVKQNLNGEMIVVLFEQCDLSCQSCYQDHDSTLGIDTVREKFIIIQKSLDTLKERGKTSVSINFMGGELFSDRLPDSIFDDYLYLIENTRLYAKSIDMPIKISIPTNMIWKEKERVYNFLLKSDIILMASYDPAGSFNPRTFELFKQNILEFTDHITQIGVVMTKPNIKKFMSNNVPFFDYLYENFQVCFDHYTHSEKAKISPEILMPSDTELRDFYKYMIQNYPKAYPFSETMDKNSQPMFCMRTVYVFPDDSFGSCGSVEKLISPSLKREGKKIINILKKPEVSPIEKKIEANWYKQYDCLSCEHMRRCSMGCFLNNHFYSTRTKEACWLKEVYDYVDEKK